VEPASNLPSEPILAISGSLRRDSINSAALRAAASAAAREGLAVVIDDSPRALPHFNPDLDLFPPEVVRRFRRSCAEAGAIMLAVPEYTFGIPGAFKNALDWLVGSGSLYRKPIAVLHTAAPGRGAHVREALTHVLRAHHAVVAHYRLPLAPRDRNTNGDITDERIVEELSVILKATRHAERPLRTG
jgi:NAD(P)H-dependent FMN reductase